MRKKNRNQISITIFQYSNLYQVSSLPLHYRNFLQLSSKAFLFSVNI